MIKLYYSRIFLRGFFLQGTLISEGTKSKFTVKYKKGNEQERGRLFKKFLPNEINDHELGIPGYNQQTF